MISKNTCEVFMNDIMEEEYEINLNLQTKSNPNLELEKKNNERKLFKFAYSKNNLEVTWQNNYVGSFCV
jgi:hypothetical protein